MKRLTPFYVGLFVIAFTSLYQNCGDFASEDLNSSLEGGPVPTIGSPVSGPTTATPIPFVLNFDVTIYGMNQNLINVTNGVVTNFKTVSEGRNYSFDVTPTNWGDVIVYLPPRAVKDGIGKDSMPSNTFSIIFGSATSNRFEISVTDNRKFPFYFNKNGAPFGTPCAIQAQSNERDVTCTLDIAEGDLHFNGFELNYQSPPGMCRYIQYETYSYYNYETGIGPKNVTVYLNRNNTPHPGCGATNASFCYRLDNNPTVFLANAALTATQEVSEVNRETLIPTCRYDYSIKGGPNCCLGGYNLTTNVIGLRASPTDPEPANIESPKPFTTWGGDFKNCLAGPGADDGWPKTKDGFPIPQILYSASGLIEKHVVAPPLSLFDGYNISAANFFAPGNLANNTGLHYHTGRTFTTLESVFPIAIDPIDDRFVSVATAQAYFPTGERMPETSPYYSFTCLDQAWEVLHRVRVQVREWNTYREFLDYGTSRGATGNPDIVGQEGVNCNMEFMSGDGCNDSFDWDDIATAAGVNADRGAYFPSAPYKK